MLPSHAVENRSSELLAAVDTFEFGLREAFILMEMSDIIDAQHSGDAWIKLYNVGSDAVKYDGDAPHINVISYWGQAGRHYQGGIGAHFYPTAAGHLDIDKTWYAWDAAMHCPHGDSVPAVNAWTQHVDANCDLLWEERVSADGQLELRRDANSPIYTLRSNTANDLDILRNGRVIRNVRRSFYDTWINHLTPDAEGTAKVIWEIRDYQTNTLITETITARPSSGEIVSHERIETR
ncbi:MAG: hypothetical protein R2856_34475 [Caldilineaceae bacterium]